MAERDVRYAPDRKGSVDLAKADVEHRSLGSGDDVSQLEMNGIDEKRLLRKIDLHLLPVLSLLYLLSYVAFSRARLTCQLPRPYQRASRYAPSLTFQIGNASLFNLQVDLKLQGMQYSAALAVRRSALSAH